MSRFSANVKDKLEALWRAIKNYDDKNKWGWWANVTALSLESVENTMKISEERALETISGRVLGDVKWALANITQSGYNVAGIKAQLVLLRDFISPKPEASAPVEAKVDPVETARRKKRLEELLQELRELFTIT
jgi:hypothetical protein